MKKRIEKWIGWIGIAGIIILSATILGFGFRLLWEFGDSIWTVLKKK